MLKSETNCSSVFRQQQQQQRERQTRYRKKENSRHSLTTGSKESSPSPIIINTDAINFSCEALDDHNNRLVTNTIEQTQKSIEKQNSTVATSSTTISKKDSRYTTSRDTSEHTRKSKSSFPFFVDCNKSPVYKISGHPISITNTYKMMNHRNSINFYYFMALTLLTLCALSTTTQTIQFVLADNQLVSAVQRLKINQDLQIDINSYTTPIRVELNNNNVKPGDIVPAKNFKDLNLAKITWDVDDPNQRHTLLLLDIDRKSDVNNSTNIYNQYTSLNIPGNVISAGQAIVAFDTVVVPCKPNTKHRVLVLAFSQDQNIEISDVAYISASSGQSSKREYFKLKEFISRHRLRLVAANVMQAVGESGGVCSGSVSIHSIQNVSILIAMVTAISALLRFTSGHRQ